uniref:VP2 n=1 Tax=Equine encephalosis virus 5 TaxID=201495 RepID=A0A7U1BC69_9REOV|nr:VP2 [Equine encephalosis virus 5]
MDFRVLVCNDTSGQSSLTDADLETFQDETTIIFRADRRLLDRINRTTQAKQDVEWLGTGIPKEWPSGETGAWPVGTTSFDVRPDAEPITEALKKSYLNRETSTTQLVSIKYGKILKKARLREENLLGLEKTRLEEQVSIMCELNQNRDIMVRDIFTTTQNRIKIKTLVGTIDLPGWLDSLYSLVRESKHREVCMWRREDFLFYELGVMNLYENYKHINSSLVLGSDVQEVDGLIKTEISKLRKGLFQRRKFEDLRMIKDLPRCQSGTDVEAPEGVTYGYLSVYMKLLQISSIEYLRSEEREICTLVESHTPREFRSFEKFKMTQNSRTLLGINEILNRRDKILGITRTHRTERGRFFFDTGSPEYGRWRRKMEAKPLGFSIQQYAHWIMKTDNNGIKSYFQGEVNFANFLRRWKVIPRDLRFANVYARNGTRETDAVCRELFKTIHAYLTNDILNVLFTDKDDLVFAKILEMTLRTTYNNSIPQSENGSLSSFIKVLIFAMGGGKSGTTFNKYEVKIDDDTAQGVFWMSEQNNSVPVSVGINLTERSRDSCRNFLDKLKDDPSYDAGVEKDVLLGEEEDVHGMFPADEIKDEWINVPRFNGYRYKLYRSVGRKDARHVMTYIEALACPQTQYLRHDTILRGGCRQHRERVHDRTYSNRLRQFTPKEGEGRHPCLPAKIIRVNDSGLGSVLVFFLYRFIDQERLASELCRQMLRKPERFPQELRDALQEQFPSYLEELMRAVDAYDRSSRTLLRHEIKALIFNPGNCYSLDVSLDQALVDWFGLKTSVKYFAEVIRSVEKKSKEIANMFSSLAFHGVARDLFIWNIHVILTNLFVPDFLEFKRSVPMFVMTSKEILPIPMTVQSYTEGNASLTALRYFDSLVNVDLLDEKLPKDSLALVENLRDYYLSSRQWENRNRSLEGRYAVFQTWLGLGCEGVREKFEVLVPTARPNQSHFKIVMTSEEMSESDVADVEAVLDEGEGLGGLSISVRDGDVEIKEESLKVKRYKHLVHNEMVEGSIIRLETASRFDTYMPAKILN